MQGRRGADPLKVKTKAVKSRNVASSPLKECDVASVQRQEEMPAWGLGKLPEGKERIQRE